MKRLPGPLLLLASLLLLPALCRAQGEGGGGRRSLTGRVYYDTTEPAENVLVELFNSEDLPVARTMTNTAGEFRFIGLQREIYTIRIDIQEYEPVSFTADLSFYSSTGNVVNLRKRNEFGRKPEPGANVSSHVLSMPESARNAFDAGKRKLYQDKNAQGSLEEFQKAVATAPGFYEAYEQMGIAYLQMGKPEDAEKAVRKSIDLSGDNYAPADFDLGAMVLNRKQFSEGEKLVRHGLELEPNSWLGNYQLGRALFYQKRVADAQKSAEQARTLQPGAPIIYRLLANIHLSQHDNAALLQDLDAYIKLDPDSPLGLRAKQLREQLQQSGASKPVPASVPTKP